MKVNGKNILIQLVIAIFLLLFFEIGAWFHLYSKNQQFPPIIMNAERMPQGHYMEIYDAVNPLLGWSFSKEAAKEKGFNSKEECIILGNEDIDTSTITVLITGGSTSDIYIHPPNWPTFLDSILDANNHNYRLLVGAIGGYNSGQELLKLISIQSVFNFDVHISYSGANEKYPYYVSPYEMGLFKARIYSPPSLLPNLSMVVKNWLDIQKENPSIQTNNLSYNRKHNISPDMFWHKNMMFMHELNKSLNSEFIGIVQPVLNYSNNQDKEGYDELFDQVKSTMREYENYYPSLLSHAADEDYLLDFTSIFENSVELPFEDDCHLSGTKHQRVIAEKMYDLISHAFDSSE